MTTFIRVFHRDGLDERIVAMLGSMLGISGVDRDDCVATFRCADLSADLPDDTREALHEACDAHLVDYAILQGDPRLSQYRLLALDMDSTLITMECIDEFAALAGVGDDVARMTQAAINGSAQDYAESMRTRVRMLGGLHRDRILAMLGHKLALTRGAEDLVRAAKAAGLRIIVISGGFRMVADEVRKRIAVDRTFAHALEFDAGRLTGRLLGDVIDSDGKARLLSAYCARNGIDRGQVIAVGDGANDIGMAKFAGTFAGYKPKPVLRRFCSVILNHHGLDGLLLAFRRS